MAATCSGSVAGQGRFLAGLVAVNGVFFGQFHFCLFFAVDRSRGVLELGDSHRLFGQVGHLKHTYSLSSGMYRISATAILSTVRYFS